MHSKLINQVGNFVCRKITREDHSRAHEFILRRCSPGCRINFLEISARTRVAYTYVCTHVVRRKSVHFLPVCLFPSTQPPRRNKRSAGGIFLDGSHRDTSPRGCRKRRPSTVLSLIYFRFPPLSRQTRPTPPRHDSRSRSNRAKMTLLLLPLFLSVAPAIFTVSAWNILLSFFFFSNFWNLRFSKMDSSKCSIVRGGGKENSNKNWNSSDILTTLELKKFFTRLIKLPGRRRTILFAPYHPSPLKGANFCTKLYWIVAKLKFVRLQDRLCEIGRLVAHNWTSTPIFFNHSKISPRSHNICDVSTGKRLQ